jgi:hypothetical protein
MPPAQTAVNRCRLCLQEKKLCDSHIIPEFLYRPIYDPQHRIIQVSGAGRQGKHHKKGLREKLFCRGCEDKFGKLEKYAGDFLYSEAGANAQIGTEEYRDFIVIRGLDYTKFKLFQMSLIWRAGISSKPEFANVQLGGRHQEQLRLMLLKGDPGEPHQYGCFMIITPTYYEVLEKMMMFAEERRFSDNRCYMFLLAGLTWIFVVSSHSGTIPFKEKLFLSKDGTLPIMVEDKVSKQYFEKTVAGWQNSGQLEAVMKKYSK